MSETDRLTEDDDEPRFYEIRVKGHLADRWGNWFEGLTITREANSTTLLIGLVTDQAALYGLLRKVRDLGLPLISVNRRKPDQSDPLAIKY